MRPGIAAATMARVTARMRRTAAGSRSDRVRSLVTAVGPSTLARVALGAMLVAAAAFLYHETRDTTLWRDDWTWALHRRGNDLSTFLTPHYGHFSLIPIAIYRVLFATVGIDHHGPYRAMVIAAHLGCVVLLFTYVARRVGSFLGLLVAALFLFLGPASQNILWPFQVGWLISLGSGVGALLMLDRRDRAGDVGACGLVAVSLASSGVGIPVALGVAADVVLSRRRWRDVWIIGLPVAFYGLWWLAYQTSQTQHWAQDIFLTPGFSINAPADALSALAGLAGSTSIDGPDSALTWGAPMLAVAAAALVWRLVRLGTLPVRVVTLLTMMLSFWILTALGRAFFGTPAAGRYLYASALFVLLLASEAARGISLSRRASLLLTAGVAAAVVSNVGAFRDAARDLRGQAQLTRIELGALEVARPVVQPGYVSEGFRFKEVVAGPYFATTKALGTPAMRPPEIAGAPENLRLAADSQLLHIHRVGLRNNTGPVRTTSRPVVDSVTGGNVNARGGCVIFRPAPFTPSPASNELSVTMPRGGLTVTADGGPATVGVRRFAAGYSAQPQGTLVAGATGSLRILPDLAPQPWHVRVTPVDGATVCGVA
jgi:hypothetical protein